MTIRTLNISGREWASSGINPYRFIGALYSTKCYTFARMKNDYRPMLTLHLIWGPVWLQLPWHHSDQRKGRTIGRSWGAVVSLGRMPFRPQMYWGS